MSVGRTTSHRPAYAAGDALCVVVRTRAATADEV